MFYFTIQVFKIGILLAASVPLLPVLSISPPLLFLSLAILITLPGSQPSAPCVPQLLAPPSCGSFRSQLKLLPAGWFW